MVAQAKPGGIMTIEIRRIEGELDRHLGWRTPRPR
jgi:hypothetical protein